MASGLSTRSAAVLLAGVVLAWGTNWPVTKMIVQDVPPLWATALRCMIAAATLAPMLWAQGQFIVPKRGDLPVVFCTSILHLVAFSALVAAGLQFVPAGRAIVLGYTTPLWVAIGAALGPRSALKLPIRWTGADAVPINRRQKVNVFSNMPVSK